jgi:hypothetical protein
MNDKCKNNQCPTPQECGGNNPNPNHIREAEPAKKNRNGLTTN